MRAKSGTYRATAAGRVSRGKITNSRNLPAHARCLLEQQGGTQSVLTIIAHGLNSAFRLSGSSLRPAAGEGWHHRGQCTALRLNPFLLHTCRGWG